MANETKVGELVVNLRMSTEALEKGLKTAQDKLKSLEEENKNVQNSNKSLDASFIAMSASIVASLVKIKSAVSDGVEKYNSYVNSMTALEKTAKATNNSIDDIKNSIEEINNLKLMDESDVTAATKNLLTYGFTVEQTTDILKVLQDAAVGNRQECYTLSEAVRVTTEGIRMENSVLSDAAGVQKNISKMYEEHANKIGKKTDTLTQAEKAQAVYNGIMDEAARFEGSAAEMADGYQGIQAKLNATNLELSRTIGESMIPALTQYKTVQLDIISKLSSFIKNHKTATSGIITFTTALLATVVAVGAVKKAVTAYTEKTQIANTLTNELTASVLKNPLFTGGGILSAGLTIINAICSKVQELIDKSEEIEESSKGVSEIMERLNNVENLEDYELSNIEKETLEKARDNANEIIKVYEEKKKAIDDIESEIQNLENSKGVSLSKSLKLDELKTNLKVSKDELKKFELENRMAEKTLQNYKGEVEVINNVLRVNTKVQEQNALKQDYLTKTNAKAQRETLVNIAQTKADVQGKQELLNILKKGETATEEYSNAKSQLVKAYPELAKVNENTINSTQALIDEENKLAEVEWVNAQQAITDSILQVTAMQNNSEQIKKIAEVTEQSVEQVTTSLQNQINVLSNLAKLSPEDFKGSVTPAYTPKPIKSSGSSSYQNKALDNYKKQIEHKKALDQLSLQDEISMYQTALKKYAKTTDEKMELNQKIYELQKELQQKELDDYTSFIDYKKSLDQISIQDEINMYQYAYDNLAKTTEQKRELEVTLYELRKELQEKEEENQQAMLDSHLEYIQYKKSLDQLSLQDEINMYQYAYDNLAKTTEQKKDLEVTLYSLRKELEEKILDDYIADIEHKKNLDQLSLKEELNMYKYALNNYAKTAEQKKELRETIYNLNKEIAQKEKELLDEQTEDYEKQMEEQKALRGAAYSIDEQSKDYDKIISIHKKYLSQIMKDERLSLEERKQIYKEELELVKDYEKQKRDLRVTSIDNTVSHLKSAITKQLEEMQSKEKELLDESLASIEEWKEARINAVNEEYDARIEAIEKELEALDKAEEQKTRAEEDADYEKSKLRLEQLIAYEHDATTKANYQKELDKLVSDHQKTLDKRALSDKKEALKEQKELLKEEQNDAVKKIEEETKLKKEQYDEQLKVVEEYYKKQIDKAEETAQQMLINAEQNQNQIIELLRSYGDAYAITGQTFGEKLGQNFAETAMAKIQNAISRMQQIIDNAIENNIAKIANSTEKYASKIEDKNTVISKTVNVEQNNTITAPVERPLETYKKQETLNRNLANKIASVF